MCFLNDLTCSYQDSVTGSMCFDVKMNKNMFKMWKMKYFYIELFLDRKHPAILEMALLVGSRGAAVGGRVPCSVSPPVPLMPPSSLLSASGDHSSRSLGVSALRPSSPRGLGAEQLPRSSACASLPAGR